MTNVYGGELAFPATEEHGLNSGAPGMTLRDYFAAHAPIGVADANEAFYREHGLNARTSEMLDVLARLRIAYADAMLKARGA